MPTLHSGTGFQPVGLHRPEAGATDQGAPPFPTAPEVYWCDPSIAAFFSLAKAAFLSYSRR